MSKVTHLQGYENQQQQYVVIPCNDLVDAPVVDFTVLNLLVCEPLPLTVFPDNCNNENCASGDIINDVAGTYHRIVSAEPSAWYKDAMNEINSCVALAD